MIQVQGLSFRYQTGKEDAVRSLNFTVDTGEIFGILGPSGAGKSTTQKILIGLLKEYKGEVKIDNRDLKTWGSDYYERVGVSFESPNHFLKLTALENLDYFRSLYSGETEDPAGILSLLNLKDDAGVRVANFSKGMKVRLNFARALLNKPELLFLDEPTAGLDPVNARNVKDKILSLKNEGKTILLTTHDMTLADELCDRVAFIVDGEVKRIDTPKNLKLQYGERSVAVEYFDNQQILVSRFPIEGLGENNTFLDLLRTKEIKTIHTQEATLETIFIRVTGRELT